MLRTREDARGLDSVDGRLECRDPGSLGQVSCKSSAGSPPKMASRSFPKGGQQCWWCLPRLSGEAEISGRNRKSCQQLRYQRTSVLTVYHCTTASSTPSPAAHSTRGHGANGANGAHGATLRRRGRPIPLAAGMRQYVLGIQLRADGSALNHAHHHSLSPSPTNISVQSGIFLVSRRIEKIRNAFYA